MKRAICLMLLAGVILAQTSAPASVSVTVKVGAVQKIWTFLFGSPTQITGFTCTQPADATSTAAGVTVLMPGDSSVCTVTVQIGVGVPLTTQVSVSVPSPLVASADPSTAGGATFSGTVLTIPAPNGMTNGTNTSSGTFVVSYPAAAPAAALKVMPGAYSIWTPTAPARYYSELMIPCCARADLCGYGIDQVSQEPCQ